MSGLRLLLIVGAFAGMVALCVVLFDVGGVGGLIGGGLGFLLRLGGRGIDWGERIGNAFIGALMGMPLGLLAGALYFFFAPQVIDILNAPPQ